LADLTGVIDSHLHSAPDLKQRSVDDLELAQEAARLGVRAFVIKSHFMPTQDRAYLVNRVVEGVQAFGSITLNPSVGGINPEAVKASLRLGAKIVWLPTMFADNQTRLEGRGGGVVVVEDGKPVKALVEVMKIIADFDAVLATGHISSDEIFIVAEEAFKQRIRKVVVTHPELSVVNMSIPRQKELRTAFPVYFDRVYAQPAGKGMWKPNLEINVQAIREVGFESTVISSDAGQALTENLPWGDTWNHYIDYLESSGVSTESIDHMARKIPAWLLDLPY